MQKSRGSFRHSGHSARTQKSSLSAGEFWKVSLRDVIVGNIIVSKLLAFALGAILLLSCTGPSDSNPASKAFALLKNPGNFFWYPNDQAVGDSVLGHLPSGVIVPLQAQGQYHFVVRGTYSAPEIQIYPLVVSGENMRVSSQGETIVLKQTAEGVWEGDWIGSAQAEMRRCVLLSDGGHRASAPLSVQLGGQGSHGLGISLQVVALSKSYKAQSSRDSLSSAIQSQLQKIYGPAGLVLEAVEVIDGSMHPKYGSLFAQGSAFRLDKDLWTLKFSSPAGEQSLKFDEISSGYSGADAQKLQIALVDSVEGALSVIGLSPYFGQSLIAGSASSIELSGYYRAGGALKRSTPSEIATTLAHEFGHFLGLRHTTVHLENRIDLSIVEDGLADTPYSAMCSLAGKVLSGSKGVAWQVAGVAVSQNLCPDRAYLMFPFVDPSIQQESLSASEAAIAMKNLSLFPRE